MKRKLWKTKEEIEMASFAFQDIVDTLRRFNIEEKVILLKCVFVYEIIACFYGNIRKGCEEK